MSIGDATLSQIMVDMAQTGGINLYHNLNDITAKTVFLTGGGLNIMVVIH